MFRHRPPQSQQQPLKRYIDTDRATWHLCVPVQDKAEYVHLELQARAGNHTAMCRLVQKFTEGLCLHQDCTVRNMCVFWSRYSGLRRLSLRKCDADSVMCGPPASGYWDLFECEDMTAFPGINWQHVRHVRMPIRCIPKLPWLDQFMLCHAFATHPNVCFTGTTAYAVSSYALSSYVTMLRRHCNTMAMRLVVDVQAAGSYSVKGIQDLVRLFPRAMLVLRPGYNDARVMQWIKAITQHCCNAHILSYDSKRAHKLRHRLKGRVCETTIFSYAFSYPRRGFCMTYPGSTNGHASRVSEFTMQQLLKQWM